MLFNKTSNGAAELKELLGFIYRSSKFENLISYIGFGEREIKKIIGHEVFLLADGHYKSDHYKLTEADPAHPEYALLDELVTKIQLPVALHAYRRYAPSNDVTHSDKGRQIFVSEDEKPAFEWMLDKDDQNLLDLAHLAVDVLLDFLQEHLEDDPDTSQIAATWGVSETYSALKGLFVYDVTIFENTFFINGSRRVLMAVLPSIREAQENEIRPCLTEEKYEELQELQRDDDLADQDKVIVDKIRPALVYLSLSKAVKRLAIEVLPNGLFLNLVSTVVRGKTPASAMDRIELSKVLEQEGRRELKKLTEYLRKLSQEASGETYTPVDPFERMDMTQKYFRP